MTILKEDVFGQGPAALAYKATRGSLTPQGKMKNKNDFNFKIFSGLQYKAHQVKKDNQISQTHLIHKHLKHFAGLLPLTV